MTTLSEWEGERGDRFASLIDSLSQAVNNELTAGAATAAERAALLADDDYRDLTLRLLSQADMLATDKAVSAIRQVVQAHLEAQRDWAANEATYRPHASFREILYFHLYSDGSRRHLLGKANLDAGDGPPDVPAAAAQLAELAFDDMARLVGGGGTGRLAEGATFRFAHTDGQGRERTAIPLWALRLREPLEQGQVVLASGRGRAGGTFHMLAHTGKVVRHPYWGQLAIDLSGVEIGSERKPVLRDHKSEWIVGQTTSIRRTPKGIEAEGLFSDKTAHGREVRDLADDDFPWQASIYVPPLQIERVPEGSEAEVNGHTLKGPGSIFRKSRLREVSFCALGMDDDTSAGIIGR